MKNASDYFEMFYKAVKNMSLYDVYLQAMHLFKETVKTEPPKATEDYTDRDYLESAIEAVALVHCLIYKIDYLTFFENHEELRKLSENNKLLDHLFKMKFDLFGKEILAEMGLEIVGRAGDDLLIHDRNKYS